MVPFPHMRVIAAFSLICTALAHAQAPLPGTLPLDPVTNTVPAMLRGIDACLDRATQAARDARTAAWKPDQASAATYERWMNERRARLRKIIGAVDPREPLRGIEFRQSADQSSLVATIGNCQVHRVRWPVLPGMYAEGLMLEPAEPLANVVALPDADWTPEDVAGLTKTPGAAPFALRLAANGCRVLVPALIDRADTWSGNPKIRMTNQPHREYVYRGAYQMGRHVIGYEVQKVLAAVDWFRATDAPGPTSAPAAASPRAALPVGVFGYGEGGLIAFYSAAVDPRIDAVAVSGYFGPREQLWREPVYRNVWTLLRDFGDAELLTMIAPRTAIIEASPAPKVAGPPAPRDGRSGGAPGRIETPPIESIREEFERATRLLDNPDLSGRFELVEAEQGGPAPIASRQAIASFLHALSIHHPPLAAGDAPTSRPSNTNVAAARDDRARRQLDQMLAYTQRLVGSAPERRKEYWAKADATSPDRWVASTRSYRDAFATDFIGRLAAPTGPIEVASRRIYDEPTWQGWEIRLPVYPDVFASGILLLPRDIQPGERRPVVVCQHGLEGTPRDTIDANVPGFAYYQSFSRRLAEQGFIVYAPQNPYTGGNAFRLLQRKANPLGLSLFSFITAQHQRTLEWLASLPYADAARIGFYGLSYGGKTAMRVPSVLTRYALCICSGDFNEWTWKTTSTDFSSSFMFVDEFEVFEFDQGNTFGYAEMAGLIAPRPFMVERGHRDPVGTDAWVAHEYAKVLRLYRDLAIPQQTQIAYFDGAHRIDGAETFRFLRHHLALKATSAPGP